MPMIDLSPIEIPPPTQLQEIRTSRLRQFGPVLSGIDKTLQFGRLRVSKLGLPDDEHDLTFHGGIDKAVHQYCSRNYSFWQDLYPDEPIKSRFVPGGFGENLVADGFDEANICIGDLIRIGPSESSVTGGVSGCVLEVSLPRQPCFKLNQRFGIKNFAPKTHQNSKTGWYYRVKEEGDIEVGMEMRVIQRDHSKWSISRLHHFVHRDKTDMEVTRELIKIEAMGDECRSVFEKRWETERERAREKESMVARPFRVAMKVMETPRIVRIELEAAEKSENVDKIPFGSYAIIKLPNGLRRAYSVVSGDMNRFILGIARDDNSRGGSIYIHDELEPESTLTVHKIDRSIQPSGMASYYIFIVGGVGITAFLAMMSTVMAINQTFELHYAVRTTDEVAFRSLLTSLGSSVRVYDKSMGERMNIDQILRDRVWNSQVYACGPQRMIDATAEAAAAAGMTEEEVHYEVFSADTSGDPFTAEVVGQDRQITLNVGSDNILLEALREAGLEVGSSCETGKCGTCRITVRCGKIDHRGSGLTKAEQEKEMLSCISRGIGHIEIELAEI